MRGRHIPLSPARRPVGDLLHFAAGVPTVPVQRPMRLGPVVRARAALTDRPPWAAVFVKGMGLVSAEVPELRRAYLKWPYSHLYEFPVPVASLAVERDLGGEKVVLMGRLKDPAGESLADLTGRLRGLTRVPVREVPEFRRALRLARWPRPVRRAVWWAGLNHARPRGRHFGTFGVSVYSALGAESLHPIAPFTSLLTYGVIAADGLADVRLVYDHRVLDGATVARALGRLEEVLTGPIAGELWGLAGAVAA